MLGNKTSSPSRTYVAACTKIGFNGYYFRKFVLPMRFENNTDQASWYFLKKLDFGACIDGCYTIEDYNNLKEVSDPTEENGQNLIGMLEKICDALAERIGGSAEFIPMSDRKNNSLILWKKPMDVSKEFEMKKGASILSAERQIKFYVPWGLLSTVSNPVTYFADRFAKEYNEMELNKI